jgi:hypothetical protein
VTTDFLTQLKMAGLPAPKPEHEFHPERGWRWDYSWPRERVALEVHGAVWKRGRHTRGAGFTEDRRKMNEGTLAGWLVLEVTTEMVTSGEALAFVERALAHRGVRAGGG